MDNHETLKQEIADYVHDNDLQKGMNTHKTQEKTEAGRRLEKRLLHVI
jgi:hypothetical protein